MKNKATTTLLQKTVEIFSQKKEVAKIFSFGSINTKEADRYSDVDVTVITNDIAETTKALLAILSKIDNIMSTFTLFEGEDSVAYTIFFDNYSPYQKLDLGIVSSKSKAPLFENSKLEYKNKKPSKVITTKYSSLNESQKDHEIMDCVIGSLRYLKYIGRGEIWIAYKFYRGFIEQYLKLKVNLPVDNPMTLNSFKNVQKLHNNNLTELIFNESVDAMSLKYLQYLEKYYILSKTEISNENKLFIKGIISFWKDELNYGKIY